MGHGVRDAGQSAHRLRPHRAAGHDSGCGAVERLLGGLPTAQPHRGPGARGDVHRDLRAGAGSRRTRRSRRRRGVRAPTRHARDHAAVDHDGGLGCVRPTARRADAGQRSRGQSRTDDRIRLSASAPGVLLRPVLGVHGDPQHPQRVRAPRVGARVQQPGGHRHLGTVSACTWRAFGRSRSDGQSQAAGARYRHDAWHGHSGRGAARRHSSGTDQPASAVGHRRPAEEVRHDGLRHGAVCGDQPDRFDRRQPNRQWRSGFGPGDLQLHLAGADAAVRHDRRDGADGRDAAAEPQRRRRRHPRGARRPVAGHAADNGDADSDRRDDDRRWPRDRQRAVRLWQLR